MAERGWAIILPLFFVSAPQVHQLHPVNITRRTAAAYEKGEEDRGKAGTADKEGKPEGNRGHDWSVSLLFFIFFGFV